MQTQTINVTVDDSKFEMRPALPEVKVTQPVKFVVQLSSATGRWKAVEIGNFRRLDGGTVTALSGTLRCGVGPASEHDMRLQVELNAPVDGEFDVVLNPGDGDQFLIDPGIILQPGP